MGHYDSCRDSTWEIKNTFCKKSGNGKHKWFKSGYGVKKCKHCSEVIYYT